MLMTDNLPSKQEEKWKSYPKSFTSKDDFNTLINSPDPKVMDVMQSLHLDTTKDSKSSYHCQRVILI